MRALLLKSAGIGALIALMASFFYCLLSGDTIPRPLWINLPFSPGILVFLIAVFFHAPLWVCMTLGGLTMTLFGALIGGLTGFCIAWLRHALRRPASP